LKPFCGQNIVIAVLSYEFDNSTSRRTESELTASKKVIVVVGCIKLCKQMTVKKYKHYTK
jgi:hypothetical protein